MYEAQHPKEWEFIVRDCEAKVLVVASDAILDKARGFTSSTPTLKSVVVLDEPRNGARDGQANVTSYGALLGASPVPSIAPEPSDIAGLIYTSGTTGNPKGVILTHGNIASNVSAVREIFPVELADKSLSFLPWAHVFGQSASSTCSCSAGAAMALCESVDRILENLAEVQPTLLFSVPRIFNKIYTAVQKQIAAQPKPIQIMVHEALKITAKERTGERLRVRELALLKVVDRLVFAKVRARFGGRLKYAFTGGAALSREVAEFIDSLGITVYEGYGLTETSPIATANAPGSRKIGSVGRPIPGVRVEIDPATGENRPTPDGKTRFEGEIVVYGPNVMQGYLQPPGGERSGLHEGRRLPHRRHGLRRPAGLSLHHGPNQGAVQARERQVRRPDAARGSLKLTPYVVNAMVYGDNRPYNVALVVAECPGGAPVGRDRAPAAAQRRRRGPQGRSRARALQGRDRQARGCVQGLRGHPGVRPHRRRLHDRQRDAHAEPEAEAAKGGRDVRDGPRADVRQGQCLGADGGRRCAGVKRPIDPK